MPQRDYEITIGADGNVELHVKGFKGKRCLEAVRLFEQVIGNVQSQQHTSEFYEPDEEVRHHLEQKQ